MIKTIAIAGLRQGDPTLAASCYKLEGEELFLLSLHYAEQSFSVVITAEQLCELQGLLGRVYMR